jgi:hypothetical protein
MSTINPVQMPTDIRKSGGWVRAFATEAEVSMAAKSDESGGIVQTKQGVLIPHQYLLWAILIVLGTGGGSTVLNALNGRGETHAITQQGEVIAGLLQRLDQKIGLLAEHMDELDARMTSP